MGYITVEELLASAVIDEIKNCIDTNKLQFLIDYCSDIIDSYTGTDFYKYEKETRSYDGYGSRKLPLDKRLYNLISVEDTIHFKNYNNVIVRSNKYELYNREELFISDTENISVTGDWGWEYVPGKIIVVLISLCNQLFTNIDDEDRLKNAAGPYKQEQIGDYSYQLKDNKTDYTITTGDSKLDNILDEFSVYKFSIEVI